MGEVPVYAEVGDWKEASVIAKSRSVGKITSQEIANSAICCEARDRFLVTQTTDQVVWKFWEDRDVWRARQQKGANL